MRRLSVAASATIVAALSAASAQAAPGIQGRALAVGRPRRADREGRADGAPTRIGAPRRAAGHVEPVGTPRSLSAKSGSVASGLSGKPVVAARQWIAANRALLGIGSGRLELVRTAPIGAGSAVMLRQRYGSLAAARDGLIVVAVVGGRVQYVSSSLAQDTALTNAVKLDADAAVRAAAANAGVSPSDRYGQPKLVAIPTPERGVRRVWMVQLYRPGTDPQGFASYVDAETATLLVRDALVDHAADNPTWKVFPARRRSTTSTTTAEFSGAGRRGRLRQRGREPVLAGPVGRRLAYERVHVHDPRQQLDRGPELELSNNSRTVGTEPATSRPTATTTTRGRTSGITRAATRPSFDSRAAQRHRRCPGEPVRDAQPHARLRVPARLHRDQPSTLQAINFAQAAGSSNDPEHGNAQAGGIVGGPPVFASRDNANQFTPADGTAPITNMYLWQPIAGVVLRPVRGRRLRHVRDRRTSTRTRSRTAWSAGPNAGLAGNQAGAMGESWSDLDATEYLIETARPAATRTRSPVGPYVTGDHQAGIRNYAMNLSPLNYSRRRLRLRLQRPGCTSGRRCTPTARSGSATNYDIRQAFINAYNACTRRRCSRRAPAATSGRRSARATGAGRSSCSTRGC